MSNTLEELAKGKPITAPAEVQELVERFHSNEDGARKYNETQLRLEYVNPLFACLGWDVANKAGRSPLYRDVQHEYSMRTPEGIRAPDYCFQIGGVHKFFLETKKPSINIKSDIGPAFQVRRYGWTEQLPLCILTDFEEFAIYDCRFEPKAKDRADFARAQYYTYEHYLTKWHEIAGLFSKTAVQEGSFDSFIDKKKKGTLEVNRALIRDMEGWRDLLAKNIARNNKNLSVSQLNYLVQLTIDRIIFLRICEDRDIEEYGQMQKLLKKEQVYKGLCGIFRQADEKYNSGLFHFQDEKGRGAHDSVSLGLAIGDKPLKEIIRHLYYPKSSYVFSKIPADILGQVYEQFLGKVIRLTPAHQAKVEYKPEVRKAGGVYYTPTYIVEYIVKHTVGALLKNKTPAQAKKLRVLDPACGSGTFLLGAYQYLLQWYRDCYAKDAAKHKKLLYKDGADEWQLSTQEKKEILLSNIYGVDIDRQAVEVTKLSLLLKVLEGEHSDRLDHQRRIFHERALPDLSNNIKCGNSLIGTDFFYGKNLDMFARDEMEKINAFDWDDEARGFGKIMREGGFDAVIGNPPYARLQSLQESQPYAIETYRKNYTAASEGNFDIYVLFTEKGYKLLNKTGALGFIQPHKFMQSDFGIGLRNYLSEKKALQKIVHFGSEQVFNAATTYTCLIFLSKARQANFDFTPVENLIPDKLQEVKTYKLKQPLIGNKWHFTSPQKEKVMQKLHAQPLRLGDIVRKIFVGLQTSADSIYVLKALKWDKNLLTCYSKSLEKEIRIEAGLVKPFLMGKDVKRYTEARPLNVVIFPYEVRKGGANLMSAQYIKKNFPRGWEYLLENKKGLEGRENRRFEKTWWQFSRPQNLNEFATAKIMAPEIASSPQMTFDTNGSMYHTTKVYSFSFQEKHNSKYYLGLLNSNILWFFLTATGYVLRGGFYTFKTEYLKPFPIPKLDLTNPAQKAQHDRMVQLVDQMLAAQKQLHTSKNDSDRRHYQQKVDILDRQIDALVYALYELTPEEIGIVEGRG